MPVLKTRDHIRALTETNMQLQARAEAAEAKLKALQEAVANNLIGDNYSALKTALAQSKE